MRPNNREMWAEIYRRVGKELRRKGGSINAAVERVLCEQEAPRYYFNAPTGILIRRMNRKRRTR